MSTSSSAYRTLGAALALAVLASACGSGDALTPDVPSTLDSALADVAHPALDWASAWFSGAGIVTPAIVPTRCAFESTSQFFVCSPLTAGDLTLNQRFTLLDAGGARQSAFDATTTTGLHLENAVIGTWDLTSDTLTIDGQQVLDLTGLGTTRHTLNGTSLTLSTPRSAGPQSPTERKATITNLVIPVVATGAPTGWPLSGTIDTRSRSISVNGDTTVFIATMRFDGSSVVTLTVTVPGGIQTCRVNLATQAAGGIGCQAGGPDIPVGADAAPRAKPTLR